MNVDNTPKPQTAVPPPRTGGPSVRTRAQSDIEPDGGSASAFLSMLNALSSPAVDAEKPPIGSGVVEDAVMVDADVKALATPGFCTDGATPSHPANAAAEPSGPSSLLRDGDASGAAHGSVDARGASSASREAVDMLVAADAAAQAQQSARETQGVVQDSKEFSQETAQAAARIQESALAQADKLVAAKELDAVVLRPLVAPSASTSVASMFEAGLVGLRVPAGARGVDRGQDRHANAVAASGLVAWNDLSPAGATPHSAAPVYAPPAATAAPAAALAQRMHYWVAGGVQSAELQLDAFGGGTVEVRIAVKGDEAMVAFRSDQPQARQLLMEAMPQLKELLASEGLVLSGGFVGSAAQQKDGGHQGDRKKPAADLQPRGAQKAQVLAAVTSSRDSAAGRKVDLFV